MNKLKALRNLQEVIDLRDRAHEIVQKIVDNAPYGQYKDLWYMIFIEYEDAEIALEKSRIFE